MKALITGGSSGIGKDMAIYLSEKNIDLILVGRNISALNTVKEKCKTNVKIIANKITKYIILLINLFFKIFLFSF